MTKLASAMCLALCVSLGVAGCGGVEPKPQPRPREIDRPAAAPVIEEFQADESLPQSPVGSEPNDTETDTEDVLAPPPAEPEPFRIESMLSENREPDEPNRPALAEQPVEPMASVETVPVVEPAQSDVAEVQESEPNVATITEPTDSPPSAAERTATAEVSPDEPEPFASFRQGYAEILRDHVRDDGRVDYAGLRRKRLRLKELLSEPDELDPNAYRRWSKEEQLAFWINTYNLKMLEIIARNYPIQSSWWLRLTWPPSDIRHIEGIWSDYRFIVMDEEFVLGDVERRLFRKQFRDPRAYLAITYASRSSPPLRPTPYRGAELGEQLDAQVRAFLSSRQGFRIDRDEGIVYLSALFKPSWRGRDFVGRYATDKKFKDRPPETRAVLNFLTQYVSQEDIYFLEVENYTITYMNFDWRLNDGPMRD